MDRYDTYTALLLRHRTQVWRMCWLRARGNWDRCCDLLQEVSIALWLNFDKLRPDATPGEECAWVRLQVQSLFEHMGRRKQPITVPITASMVDSLAGDDEKRVEEDIAEVMATLNPDEQRLLSLRLEGYRPDEIAVIMGLNRDAVYQRLHRAIVKARRVLVVMLLLLLATTTVAIAVVPQWRKALFGSTEQEPVVSELVKHIPIDTVDTVATFVRLKPAPRERQEPMEYIEFAEPAIDAVEPLPSSLEAPTVAVDGCHLTVSGVYDERVTVYSMNGNMLASQICNGICTFTLFPDDDYISVGRRYCYKVKIGSRPMIEVIQ